MADDIRFDRNFDLAPGKAEEVRRIPELKDDLKIQGTRL